VAESSRKQPAAGRATFEADSLELIAQMAAKDRAREEKPLSQDAHDPDRLRRVRLTRGEIADQPRCIEETLRDERSAIQMAASVLTRRPITHAYLVGCGDSLAVMLAMRGLLEQLLRIPCQPIQALEYAYYYRPADPEALVVGLTSTGWTTKVAEAILAARMAGLRTVALSNNANAAIFSIAEIGLLVHARRDGYPTQSSTAAMALMAQLAIELAREQGMSDHDIASYQRGLDGTPSQIHDVIERHSKSVADIAMREVEAPLFLFAGGGPSFATATIGAAKIKECTPRHAIAIEIEEYHHYLSQRAGEPLFLIAPSGPSVRRAADSMRVGRANGGRVYGLVPQDSELLSTPSDGLLQLPTMEELLTPLVYSVPLQLLAYKLGILIGGAEEEAAKP